MQSKVILMSNQNNLSGTTWNYLNRDMMVQITKVSNYISKNNVTQSGDANEGEINFVSERAVDDIYGPECKVKINWIKTDPTQYHHGLKVKETIRMFSRINVVVTQKDTRWHLSHEMTYWQGTRQKMERGRYYQSAVIHAIVFCELTHRLFEIHAETYSKFAQNYRPIVMQFLESIQCHAS